MSSTQKFVSQHLDTYGLLGINNRVVSDMSRREIPASQLRMTQDNHFRFGFDDHEFSNRRSGAAMYWTEYGSSEAHSGFHDEFTSAVGMVANQAGSISVTASGSYIAAGVVAAAKKSVQILVKLLSKWMDMKLHHSISSWRRKYIELTLKS